MSTREWWNSRWVLPVAAAATAVPLLWPHIPPLADVPGHMASYHVATALGHSATLRRFFGFHWHLVGNLGVDLAVVPLAALVGVELATKLLVMLIPVLTSFGLLLLAREAHGRLPATALAALPLAYNYPFIFGFLNYNLAVALALLALAWWMRWPGDRRPLLRAATFAAVAAVVWLSHAIGWVMLGAMCGAFELYRRRVGGATWLSTLVGTAVTCAPLAVPIVLVALGPHADRNDSSGWFSVYDYIKATGTIFRDRWPAWDILSLLTLLLLLAAALFRVGGMRLSPALLCPALALLLLFLVAPGGLNGSAFVNTRIVPYALALGLIAIDTGGVAISRRAALAAGAALFLAARMVGNTASFALYDASWTRELAAVDHIPRGSVVVAMAEMPCKRRWAEWGEHRLEHIAGMATVRRDAFVNVMWNIKGLHLLENVAPQTAPFGGDPSEFVSDSYCYPSAKTAFALAPAGVFTHLWLIGVPPQDRPVDPRLTPIWSAGNSVLYRIARPAAPRT